MWRSYFWRTRGNSFSWYSAACNKNMFSWKLNSGYFSERNYFHVEKCQCNIAQYPLQQTVGITVCLTTYLYILLSFYSTRNMPSFRNVFQKFFARILCFQRFHVFLRKWGKEICITKVITRLISRPRESVARMWKTGWSCHVIFMM